MIPTRRVHPSSSMRHRSHRHHGHHSQSASPSAHGGYPSPHPRRIRNNSHTPPPVSDHDSDVDTEAWTRIRNLNIPQQLSIPQNEAAGGSGNLYLDAHRRLYESRRRSAVQSSFSPPAPMGALLGGDNVCTLTVYFSEIRKSRNSKFCFFENSSCWHQSH